MKIIFSHGKESGPWGRKIKALAQVAEGFGYEVDSIDYSGVTLPDDRVSILDSYVQNESSKVALVGSSMGGYVSVVVNGMRATEGLFLLAPALFMSNFKQQVYTPKTNNIEIIHGWDDDIIPYQNSLRFSSEFKCSLHLIDGDHRLNSSLDVVLPIFHQFCEKLSH